MQRLATTRACVPWQWGCSSHFSRWKIQFSHAHKPQKKIYFRQEIYSPSQSIEIAIAIFFLPPSSRKSFRNETIGLENKRFVVHFVVVVFNLATCEFYSPTNYNTYLFIDVSCSDYGWEEFPPPHCRLHKKPESNQFGAGKVFRKLFATNRRATQCTKELRRRKTIICGVKSPWVVPYSHKWEIPHIPPPNGRFTGSQ